MGSTKHIVGKQNILTKVILEKEKDNISKIKSDKLVIQGKNRTTGSNKRLITQGPKSLNEQKPRH